MGKKVSKCKAEVQLYRSRMPQAGQVETLQGPEEEQEDITLQQGFPLLNHSKEEPCCRFSPALPSDNF